MKVDTDRRAAASSTDALTPTGPRVTPRQLVLALVIGGVLVASTVLRFWTRSDLWFDEALSVNIARLPLGQIPEALRHDGHPPLYYFLLHGWIDAFGTGNLAVRSLSGLFSLATLPAAWFAGRRIGGRTFAWLAVLFLATSPYAFRYATEARMYSLVMLLVLTGYLALRRAMERPSIDRLVIIALITAALELTQYWAFYLLAVVGLGVAYRALRAVTATDRTTARRVLGAMVVGSLPFLGWLSVFRDQLAHTGTPWGDPQLPWVALPRTLIAFAGSDQDGEAFSLALFLLLLPILALFGRGLDRRRIELDLRTRPPVRREAAAAVGALLLGSGISYVSVTSYEPRYAAIAAPLFILVAAFGVTVFFEPRVRVAIVAIVVALGLAGGVRNVTTQRTQAHQSADVIKAEAKPGDLVVYCPDQVGPAVSRLLSDVRGLRQLTFPVFAPPDRVNWTDYLERVRRTDPKAFARKVLQRAGGHTIWLVSAPSLNHFAAPCEALATTLYNGRRGRVRVPPTDSFFEFQGLEQFPPT